MLISNYQLYAAQVTGYWDQTELTLNFVETPQMPGIISTMTFTV